MELEGKAKAKRKREQVFSEAELNDLAKDIALMKKLKNKKVILNISILLIAFAQKIYLLIR